MLEYNHNLPGRIVEYFPGDQTATIKVCVERVTNSSSELNVLVKYADIENVPVLTPSGGGWAVTFPIKPGDTCILLFSQVGYDHWLYENKDLAGTLAGLPKPWLGRNFSISDGYAIVGFNTLPQAISGVSGSDSEWRNVDSTQKIALAENGDITIDTASNLNITAPLTDVTGDINVTGTITATGDIVAGTVSLLTHTHTNGNNGSPTGPPIP